ncbi:hypothetical protein DRP07_05015 [Archaeoglobales archaeon]|nr:MAG: hypothetical protein DRP07_05015 [Archaeoglobales archaeon]
MNSEQIITKDELQILLNLIDELSMMYPLYSHFQLLSAKPEEDSYKLKILQGEMDFPEANEFPSYSDFASCLLSAGVIDYSNLRKFEELVKSYSNMKKRVYFCPDTNVVYHRFLTNYLDPSKNILLVDTVKEEIEASLNHKYSPQQIAELKKEARYQHFLLDEFVNRRMKKSRLACIAMKEYRELRKYAIEIEGVERSTSDKEANDRIIVKTLRRFERDRAALPVLLTADRQMADLCKMEEIEYFFFEVPHAVDAKKCSSKAMLNLIYNLAMVFGVIRLNSVVIFGEFKGKNSIDNLKLRFLDDNLYQSFDRHLKICRRLMKLGVEA